MAACAPPCCTRRNQRPCAGWSVQGTPSASGDGSGTTTTGQRVRRATERIDSEKLSSLRNIVDWQHALEQRRDHDAFHAADEAFHAFIAETAGHAGIWQLIEQVKVQVDRYRRLTLPVPGRMGRVIVEHSALVAAIATGDPDKASAAMAAHLDGLSASIRDVRDLNPDYFDLSEPQAAPTKAAGSQ